MTGLGAVLTGALFAGFLASGDQDKLPSPQGEWSDSVGERIREDVEQHLNGYRKALKEANSTLSEVKIKAESKAFEVEYTSRANDLNWMKRQIEEVDLRYIADQIERVLGE